MLYERKTFYLYRKKKGFNKHPKEMIKRKKVKGNIFTLTDHIHD